MQKVHSAINLLEQAVNIKEGTEVVHSGHGSSSSSGYVKNEEIEETAEDPIQDIINNLSESDEVDREHPVHTDTCSERKRKSSAASDALTSPKTRKKVKTDKDNSTNSSTVFDEWCNQLLRFKEEFGHCNVPTKRFASNLSLGKWCSNMRTAYRRIQKGMKTDANLSQDRIVRLEEIGFQWQVMPDRDEAFDKSCRALIAFKEEFGHCNVPKSYTGSPSLGQWCIDMRKVYRKIKKGMTANTNTSRDRIERLEKIGFQWDTLISFEERCRKLVAFKEEFGHCNVPNRYSVDPSLGKWCIVVRCDYNRIQQGKATIAVKLSQDRIVRLEEIGFQWQVMPDRDEAFDKSCRALIAFKEEFGHCNVPKSYTGSPSLGQWCIDMRKVYRKIKKGMTANTNTSRDRIERLEKIGFQWDTLISFEERCRKLVAFKEEFGHCNVPNRYSVDPSLGKWCIVVRCDYNRIQQGKATIAVKLSQDRIERLEEIGFKWKGKGSGTKTIDAKL